MTDQQSNQAALTAAVGTYYSKKHLKDFEPTTVWWASAPMKEDAPKGGGNIISFTRYRKINALFQDNSNQFTAQQMYQSAVEITATLHERDGYVQISRFTSLVARNNVLDQVSEKVRSAAAKTADKLIRNDIGFAVADKAVYSANMFDNLAIDGGSLNSSGITARLWTRRADGFPMYHDKTRLAQSSTVVSIASSAMTLKTLQAGVGVLTANDVDPLSNGNYQLICHPDVATDLTTNPGTKGWFSPTETDRAMRNSSEVGTIAGVTVVNTTLAYKYPVSGDTLSTSSGNVYGSLLFGSEAYATNTIAAQGGRNGYEFFLKQSGTQSTNDPTNMIKQAAFSVTAVGRVINKSAGIWIVTTEK